MPQEDPEVGRPGALASDGWEAAVAQLRLGAGSRVWSKYPRRASGGLALLPCPLHSHPVPAGRFTGISSRALSGVGRVDIRLGRRGPGQTLQRPQVAGVFIQCFVCCWVGGLTGQREPAASRVSRRVAQSLWAGSRCFPHRSKAQPATAGSGSPSPPLGGGHHMAAPGSAWPWREWFPHW